MKNKNIPPKLTELENLKDTMISTASQISDNMVIAKNDLGSVGSYTKDKLDELEMSVTGFISVELKKSKLMKKADDNHLEIKELSDKINFWGEGATEKGKAILTGAFSSSFSSEDEKNWTEIGRMLEDVYNPVSGDLKKVQDFFIHYVSKEQIASNILHKEIEDITLEEELLVRSILIKGYLVNFRELMLPFYSIDDEILIKFKKDRLKFLEENVWKEGDDYQGRLLIKDNDEDLLIIGSSKDPLHSNQIIKLREQISQLEEQSKNEKQQKQKSRNLINNITGKIGEYNSRITNSSLVASTLDTARYATSALGHKAGIGVLKTAGNFGGFLGNFVPVISGFVNAGCQIANNNVIYNYEKKLRMLELVNDTKRNLVILERQVNDYYIDSILIALQGELMAKQAKAYQTLTIAYEQQLEFGKDNVEASLELVKQEYYQNANVIIKHGDEQSEIRLEEQDSRHRVIIGEKESKIEELHNELVQLTNEIETLRNNWKSELGKLEKEKKQLKDNNLSLNKNLETTRKILKETEHSCKLLEETINTSLNGDVNNKLSILYTNAISERNTFNILLNNTLKEKNDLEEELSRIKPNIITDAELELLSKNEDLQILNQKLISERDKLKRDKEYLENKRKESEEEYTALFKDHVKMEKREGILNAAKDELIRDKNAEIEKCNNYRNRIKILGDSLKQVREETKDYNDLKISHGKLKSENNSLKKTNKSLYDLKEHFQKTSKELETKLEQSKSKFSELDKKSYREKIKLMSILGVDTARNYLPEKIPFLGWNVHKSINNLETMLFVSEVTNTGTSYTWGIWGTGLGIVFLIGLFKTITYLIRGGSKLWLLVKGGGAKTIAIQKMSEVISEQISTSKSEVVKFRPRVNGKFIKTKK